MAYVLGLDPSLRKAGYVVFDTGKSDSIVEERGLLKTSSSDGILVQRLMKQSSQIERMIKKYGIKFIGMEAPYYDAHNTELLFALNQYLHRIFLENESFVVAFPPQMLKKLVFPDQAVSIIGKPHMINKAKTMLNLQGRRLAEDVADAYWAGFFGKRFYKWHIEKTLQDTDLGEYELGVYGGKHTITRGPRKGVTDYKGIIFRENELFYDFKEIKRRTSNATIETKKRTRNKVVCPDTAGRVDPGTESTKS